MCPPFLSENFWLFPVIIMGIMMIGCMFFMCRRRTGGISFMSRRWCCMRDYHDPDSDSMEIAKQRYAKGEITKQQFEELKKDLTS
jgi:uncharacterized membrane protein